MRRLSGPAASIVQSFKSHRMRAVGPIVFCIVILLAAAYWMYDGFSHPRQYTYEKHISASGIELHVLETAPDNVQLTTIEQNVTNTPFYGINGGFFWEGALLSIAVVNDRPLKGEPGDYGSGWYNTGVNADLKRGTLVWDELTRRFTVQVATDASELSVTDKQHYWAQGGVSMGLGDEYGWENHMISEEMPAYDEERMRSALVFDRNQRLYMVVTPTPSTVYDFRLAIMERLGGRGLVDGIFLDGDGSSQLQCRARSLSGDGRPVYQMLAMKQ
ncbi:hypothetical protein EYB31_22995 [Paenibacillus thalictri]|uniref:Phosphodiester glycosidase domain-containing protein n=2 Tax=Paenibacillus thalictri TaxID=2527873 RepID=A0A4Q9DKR6_9BACL|nr:hypothetical protein EYB31_22995 [Paenibacillus thalictri]